MSAAWEPLQVALAVLALMGYLELRIVRAARDAARHGPVEERRSGGDRRRSVVAPAGQNGHDPAGPSDRS